MKNLIVFFSILSIVKLESISPKNNLKLTPAYKNYESVTNENSFIFNHLLCNCYTKDLAYGFNLTKNRNVCIEINSYYNRVNEYEVCSGFEWNIVGTTNERFYVENRLKNTRLVLTLDECKEECLTNSNNRCVAIMHVLYKSINLCHQFQYNQSTGYFGFSFINPNETTTLLTLERHSGYENITFDPEKYVGASTSSVSNKVVYRPLDSGEISPLSPPSPSPLLPSPPPPPGNARSFRFLPYETVRCSDFNFENTDISTIKVTSSRTINVCKIENGTFVKDYTFDKNENYYVQYTGNSVPYINASIPSFSYFNVTITKDVKLNGNTYKSYKHLPITYATTCNNLFGTGNNTGIKVHVDSSSTCIGFDGGFNPNYNISKYKSYVVEIDDSREDVLVQNLPIECTYDGTYTCYDYDASCSHCPHAPPSPPPPSPAPPNQAYRSKVTVMISFSTVPNLNSIKTDLEREFPSATSISVSYSSSSRRRLQSNTVIVQMFFETLSLSNSAVEIFQNTNTTTISSTWFAASGLTVNSVSSPTVNDVELITPLPPPLTPPPSPHPSPPSPPPSMCQSPWVEVLANPGGGVDVTRCYHSTQIWNGLFKLSSSSSAPSNGCWGTCLHSSNNNNGICEDGAASYSVSQLEVHPQQNTLCSYGTDCEDCGNRTYHNAFKELPAFTFKENLNINSTIDVNLVNNVQWINKITHMEIYNDICFDFHWYSKTGLLKMLHFTLRFEPDMVDCTATSCGTSTTELMAGRFTRAPDRGQIDFYLINGEPINRSHYPSLGTQCLNFTTGKDGPIDFRLQLKAYVTDFTPPLPPPSPPPAPSPPPQICFDITHTTTTSSCSYSLRRAPPNEGTVVWNEAFPTIKQGTYRVCTIYDDLQFRGSQTDSSNWKDSCGTITIAGLQMPINIGNNLNFIEVEDCMSFQNVPPQGGSTYTYDPDGPDGQWTSRNNC